jgi:hypothetical protein
MAAKALPALFAITSSSARLLAGCGFPYRVPEPVRSLMRAHSIAALLRRVDALLARAARARQEMESAKAANDERRRVLTGTGIIWRRNLNAVAASVGRKPVGLMPA